MVTMRSEMEPKTPEGRMLAECAKELIDAGADITGINRLRSRRTRCRHG